MADMDEIRRKVEAERAAKLKEERIADGVPPEEMADQLPPEWAQDVQKSAAALAAVMGGKIVGGSFDPASGSFKGFEVDTPEGHVSITFDPTDDGQTVRFLPAVFDSKPVALPPHLLEMQKRAQAGQQQGIPFPRR